MLGLLQQQEVIRYIKEKYEPAKWGLYKHIRPTIIHIDYICAIWFTANVQHQMCSIEIWAICAMCMLTSVIFPYKERKILFFVVNKLQWKYAVYCFCTQCKVCRYLWRTLVCLCVCVVGIADKQAVVVEVEGVHPLRLLTQSWQSVASGAPRKLAGGARFCNPIPSILHTAPKNTQKYTQLSAQTSPRAILFILFCYNRFSGIFLVQFACLFVCLCRTVRHTRSHSASVSGLHAVRC